MKNDFPFHSIYLQACRMHSPVHQTQTKYYPDINKKRNKISRFGRKIVCSVVPLSLCECLHFSSFIFFLFIRCVFVWETCSSPLDIEYNSMYTKKLFQVEYQVKGEFQNEHHVNTSEKSGKQIKAKLKAINQLT